MKPMLDKDFDQFFKSSFEGLEIEPAVDSWDKINSKLNHKPVQKKFPVFWMAAASIIMLLGVGIGLYTKPTDVIKLHPDGEKEIMTKLAREQEAPATTEKDMDIAASGKIKTEKSISVPIQTKNTSAAVVTKEDLTEKTVDDNSSSVAKVSTLKNVKPVRIKLATEQILEQEELADLKKASPTSNLVEDHIETSNAVNVPSKKLKLSSVGDLVNFVIAKVDKRDEKIIQISRTNESDNEITGVNLGLFKFSKTD